MKNPLFDLKPGTVILILPQAGIPPVASYRGSYAVVAYVTPDFAVTCQGRVLTDADRDGYMSASLPDVAGDNLEPLITATARIKYAALARPLEIAHPNAHLDEVQALE